MDHPLADFAWRFAGVLALVFANGFFVAAEFAIVTVRKTRLDQLIDEGNRRARAVRRAASDPASYIAATQLGITMTSLALGWVGEPAIAEFVRPGIDFLPAHIAEATAHSVSVVIAFAIVTALHITLGELAPKTIALESPERTALLVVGPTEAFRTVFWPFIRLLNGMGRGVVRLLGFHGSGGHGLVHSEEELKMLVTASQEAGVLEEEEEQMLHRVFDFADMTAGQIMVPRTELVAVEASVTGDDLLKAVAAAGFSVIPVYRTNLDNVVGMLHAVDVVKAMVSRNNDVTAGSIARETLTVPETMAADDLLVSLRQKSVREAIVIDEYGGTAGLVTFEWLMERIVGVAGRTTTHPDGSVDMDGLTLVTDVNEQFGLHIDESTYTTLGGYVMGRIGRRARLGDSIEVEGRRMRVTALDGLRVARVWISAPVQPKLDEEEERG
jgi:CBS domain containing-hemolysin-like protein